MHGVEVLLQTARLLTHIEDLTFLLVGQGFDFQRCQDTVKKEQMNNVLVKEFVPRSHLSLLQAIANVSIVTLKPEFGNTSVPSKVLGYMSAGRAVIALVEENCDTASLIKAANCGLVLESGNAGVLAQRIEYVHAHPGEVYQWGENARKYIVEHLNAQVVPGLGVALLEKIFHGL